MDDMTSRAKPTGTRGWRWVLPCACAVVAVWMVLVSLALAWVLLVLGFWEPPSEEIVRFESLQPGMTKAEVIDIVGQPHRSWTAESAPARWWIEGYSPPGRDITGAVLAYEGIPGQGAMVWRTYYIFLDTSGQVEEVVMCAD